MPQIQAVETCAVPCTATSRELSDAGNPRLNREPPVVIFGRPIQSSDVLHRQRPRTDDTHLAAPHVYELWQLIEPRSPQPPPDTRHDTGTHGAKFQNAKSLTPHPNAHLREE